jgi:hypothetical protein
MRFAFMEGGHLGTKMGSFLGDDMIEESSYNRIQDIEGYSTVVQDGLGQKRILKNTMFRPETSPLSIPAPAADLASTPPSSYSSSGLFGASKVDRLKLIYDRKRVN